MEEKLEWIIVAVSFYFSNMSSSIDDIMRAKCHDVFVTEEDCKFSGIYLTHFPSRVNCSSIQLDQVKKLPVN